MTTDLETDMTAVSVTVSPTADGTHLQLQVDMGGAGLIVLMEPGQWDELVSQGQYHRARMVEPQAEPEPGARAAEGLPDAGYLPVGTVADTVPRSQAGADKAVEDRADPPEHPHPQFDEQGTYTGPQGDPWPGAKPGSDDLER